MTLQRAQIAAARDGAGTAAISLRGVVKRFGGFTAVDGLDLEVPTGVCMGLLGPNGAGKSTTMKMLTAQAIATEGSIDVLGFSVPRESKRARAAMGVVPQQDNLDEELTARENLEVFAHLYRVPRRERREAVDDALAIAHLTERQGTKVDDLSGGMRRRLLIARGLVHRPALVLLDEPTVGLDPVLRQELWELFRELADRGATLVVSSHVMDEAGRTDRLLLMREGVVLADGTPDGLRSRTGTPDLETAFLHLITEKSGSPA